MISTNVYPVTNKRLTLCSPLYHRRFSTILPLAIPIIFGACSGTPDERVDATRSTLKVALLTPGPISDKSWNGGAYQGLMHIKDSLGAEVSHIQTRTPLNSTRTSGSTAQRTSTSSSATDSNSRTPQYGSHRVFPGRSMSRHPEPALQRTSQGSSSHSRKHPTWPGLSPVQQPARTPSA